MKYRFILLILGFTLLSAGAHSSVTFGYGYFLSHSENGNPIVGDKAFSNLKSISLHHNNRVGKKLSIRISAGYAFTQIKLYSLIVSGSGGTLGVVKTRRVYERYLPVDLQISALTPGLSGYGCGLSLVFTEHGLESFTQLGTPDEVKHTDIFSSFGLGPSAFIQWGYPIADTRFKLLAGISVRYAAALKFYGGERDFSKYDHHYLMARLNIGIGI